ncbi:cytochrome c oxidase subunit II [Sphingomonas sp. LHG3406-1]|uniref:cytochrome c oxidase subunit II n=1 Tax=Sphingomonas sp. LHG3406-1 TaxID=2804617 RepID=UPI00260F703E|nr:cytochrome c oxidase subunit II [Sphingomonas sp. LHG3406-1]
MFEGWPPPVLDPAGPYATSVSLLSWILFGMAAVVLLVVLAALYLALFGRPALQAKVGGKSAIWIGGVAFPLVVLTALLIYGLSLTRHLNDPIRGDELRVRITGEMWWWRVAYLDRSGQEVVQDANELHIPAGRPVVLELQSADVIHSFWVPRLSGKLDMIPGRRNLMRIQADKPGIFGGQCAEYCGGPHALMGFTVVAHEPAQFERMMAARTARQVSQPVLAGGGVGPQLFESTGCAACHRIAGTGANGLAGPDLTHVGSRRTLGAGILPNNHGTLMGWIGNSQAIKPNNRMPPYTLLSAEQLNELATYLEAQK